MVCQKSQFVSAWSTLPPVLLLPDPVVSSQELKALGSASSENSHSRKSQTRSTLPQGLLKEAQEHGVDAGFPLVRRVLKRFT